MQGLVALEKNLSQMAEALETAGYEVVTLNDNTMDIVDAIIISGADVNLMNMQDTDLNIPVINASGKTAEEILEDLERL